MKIFRISFVLSFCLLAASVAFAAPVDSKPNSELRKEVAKLIKTPELGKKGIAETYVFIHFMVNENKEIVVLNVVSDSDYIREHVRKSLENQKVDAQGLDAFTEYNVKISFRSEKA